MNTKFRLNVLTRTMRWLGRASSLVTTGILLLFFIGDRFNPAHVRPKEWIGLAFFPVGIVVGLIIAWWKEGLGACITLISLVAFYAIYGWLMESNVNSLAFTVFASPALFFLMTWLLSQHNSAEVAA